MGKQRRKKGTVKLQRRSPRRTRTTSARRRGTGAFVGYRSPTNGDRELRAIMREFVCDAAARKDLSPAEYEKRIRRNGSYSAVRGLCHKLLFLIEKVCEEVRAQERARRRALRAAKRRALRMSRSVALSGSKSAAA